MSCVSRSVDEVIVVDSGSQDGTAEAARRIGAQVIREERPGKHWAIRAGIAAARGRILVFADADLQNPAPTLAAQLIDGLQRSGVCLAKAGYDPEPNVGGGRLTELVAKPLLRLFHPHLSSLKSPLSGEFALFRSDALAMCLAPGFAVDLGILIDSASRGQIAEVALPIKQHKHRPLGDLTAASLQILDTALRAAGVVPPCKQSETLVDLSPLPPLTSMST